MENQPAELPVVEEKQAEVQQDVESDGNVEDAEEGEAYIPVAALCQEKQETNRL
jgi:hypothetical protein